MHDNYINFQYIFMRERGFAMSEKCCFAREELLEIRAEKPIDGFQEFWQAQYAAARAWKCEYHIEKELWSPEPGGKVYQIRFTSIDGFSIGMWLSRPAESIGGQKHKDSSACFADIETASSPASGKEAQQRCGHF